MPAERDAIVDAVVDGSRLLIAIAARSLAEAGGAVTLTQYRSLALLASRGPQGVASLAEALGVTPPTVSRLCDRLVRKGMVRRRTDRHDRRHVRVALTPTGRQLVDAVTQKHRVEIARALGLIDAEGRRSLALTLRELSAAAHRGLEAGSGW